MATQWPHALPLPNSWSVQLPLQVGYTPLLETSSNGHRDIAELLLKHKAAIEHQDKVTRCEGVGGGAYGGRSRRWRYLLLMAVEEWVSTLGAWLGG